MNYRSIEDLNHTITSSLSKIPVGTDLIVGVPRSGLLVANLLALHLNLPFTDVEGFMNGRILQTGYRLKNYIKPFPEYRKVIVIEDSVWSGRSIDEVKEKLTGIYPDKELVYAAAYVGPDTTEKVDIYFDVVPGPRIFEWNMMHHDYLEQCCVDIDGVLCIDPTEDENDDGPNYEKFLSNVDPFFRPTKTIGYLVTNRLEKYRGLTEAWLAKHNIKYNKLIMLNLPNKQARLDANNHGGFKADVYRKYGILFIESSIWQSQHIAEATGKPVYCVDARKMIYPSALNEKKATMRRLPSAIMNKLKAMWSN